MFRGVCQLGQCLLPIIPATYRPFLARFGFSAFEPISLLSGLKLADSVLISKLCGQVMNLLTPCCCWLQLFYSAWLLWNIQDDFHSNCWFPLPALSVRAAECLKCGLKLHTHAGAHLYTHTPPQRAFICIISHTNLELFICPMLWHMHMCGSELQGNMRTRVHTEAYYKLKHTHTRRHTHRQTHTHTHTHTQG